MTDFPPVVRPGHPAASGVGQHAATRYATAGSRVTALDADQDGLDSLATAITQPAKIGDTIPVFQRPYSAPPTRLRVAA